MKQVLDKGFVRLVDSMGDDMSVVKSARVSYGEESKGDKADKGLINYMMKHNHGTPFEHIVFTFHIKCPIFIARQWFRHRIGSFNEISGRYVKLDEEYYLPEIYRENTSDNKQRSTNNKDLTDKAEIQYKRAMNYAYGFYNHLLHMGVAREQARAVLPLGTYTEFYWTVNARSLMNFIKLRGSSDAQWEIQEYARVIYEMVNEICPWTMKAFWKIGKLEKEWGRKNESSI